MAYHAQDPILRRHEAQVDGRLRAPRRNAVESSRAGLVSGLGIAVIALLVIGVLAVLFLGPRLTTTQVESGTIMAPEVGETTAVPAD